MALLLFRFYLLFAIGLLLLNGFAILSVSAFVNKAGPDRLRLTVSPPAQVVIKAVKSSPIYLPCHAEAEIDSSDWIDSDMDMDDVDYENNGNEEVHILQSPHIERQRYYEDTLDINNLAHDNINNNNENDKDLDEEDEYDEDEEHSERYRRALYAREDFIEYVWYRNGLEFFSTAFQNQNHKQTHKGFRLFPNGTLRIPYNRQLGNLSAGVYRCKANLTRHGTGSILSTESVVSLAYLERNNAFISENNTIIANPQRSLVLHCPFVSHPPANITWMVNKTQINTNNNALGQLENRFYTLQNGSLLLTDVRPSDAGRYRCNATNSFAAKNTRSYSYIVVVQPTPQKPLNKLLPRMQPKLQTVTAGSVLKLICAGFAGFPRWNFTPRGGKIPISLTSFKYQLLFTNVSVDKHEGIYNCSLGADFQLYNVTVLVSPMFLNNMTSYTSSVVASVSFNCSVSGNPKPKLTWYKNGREIKNSYIIHYNYPILRINTIDPEDEGLYQCIAKNEAGEASVSMYLSIRDKDKYRRLSRRPDSIQCYPLDTTSLFIRFDNGIQHVNTEYVMYYLASDSPYSWFSSPPTQLLTNNSLKISGTMVAPFRNYTVYLRACSVTNVQEAENMGPAGKKQVIPSRLSRGIQCTSQGVPVLSILFPNGIFIWWPRFLGVQPTAFTIQFKGNENSTMPEFDSRISGTTQTLDDYITFEDVQPLLTMINITTSKFKEYVLNEGGKRRRRAFDIRKNPKQIFESLTGTQLDYDTSGSNSNLTDQEKHDASHHQVLITQIKVHANVTGILIPNARKLVVRILGSVASDGEPLQQDLRYIQWKTIDSSIRPVDTVNRFQANHIDSRSVQFIWNRFIAADLINRCLMLCYKNVNHDVFLRGGSNRVNCLNIPNEETHYNLKGLLPFTLYKAFLKPCHAKEPISDVLDFLTKQDVPGPVTNHGLIRKNGITLTWGPPENRNGILQGYLIEWLDKENLHSAVNLTINTDHFQFPNISTYDKINISIRAIGSTGIGIPIYMNLLNQADVVYDRNEPEALIPWVEIAIGTFIIVFLLMFCCLLAIHRKNCKKVNRNPTAAANAASMQMHPLNCNAEMHEMQTLIRTTEQTSVLIPNGIHREPNTEKALAQLNIFNAVVNTPDSDITHMNIESPSGKSHHLMRNRNGLVNQNSICSPTISLKTTQPTVSSQVLGSNNSNPSQSCCSKDSSSSSEKWFDTPQPQQIPIAINDNSIYRSTNFSYPNQHFNSSATGGCHANGRKNSLNGTVDSDSLQQIHSPATTTRCVETVDTTAEQVPSFAATSRTLSPVSSNISATFIGSCGTTVPPTFVQPAAQPQHQQHLLNANNQNNNKTDLSEHRAESSGFYTVTADKLVDKNPQCSKTDANSGGYNSSSAVLNTSLFDSSQRGLLDVTMDSNSIEYYDDDVTNCDQNDDASRLITTTPFSCIASSLEYSSEQQLFERLRIAPAESEIEEDDNNNEQQENNLLNNFQINCIQLQHHRQQLLNPRYLVSQCKHEECNTDERVSCAHNDDDDDNLENLDNSTSLLSEDGPNTKPLHQQHSSSWNFRQPIVGPNG
ncbi:protogenin [Toxorhynchites rutilus septentrionalis]|uniref:protogenin n=1 Tax=Toxorhynchites rutilus septentrionalis TaxID=329112 RepID=UPI002478AEA3|nr:protogenin [Toxorhynchites rutilus septentrionalis]